MHHAFSFISFRSLHNYDQILRFFWTTGTARRFILPSLSELGVAPSLQFQPKFPSLKGCGVYCSVTFLWTSPLSDRKVPNSLRQRQQRQRNNSKRFIKQTTSLQVHHAFFTFLCRCCKNTTGNCLILRFMEDVNKRRRNFLSLPKLECGPQENERQGNSPTFYIFSELEQTR